MIPTSPFYLIELMSLNHFGGKNAVLENVNRALIL